MPLLPAPELLTNRRLQSLGLDAYPTSTFDVLGSTAEETWVRNPAPSLLRDLQREQPQVEVPGQLFSPEFMEKMGAPGTIDRSRTLSNEEANRLYGIKGHLNFNDPLGVVQESTAKELYELKREELRRQNVLRRSEGGFGQGAAAFATGLAISLLDPLNIASAFVPVVGPSRYAAWAARYGNTGARAARGGVEGVAGAAALEPLVYTTARSEQADYTAVDSILNLTFGTAIGGGLHVGLGKLGDLMRDRQLTEPALRGAVAALVEDQPVRLENTLRAELLRSTTLGGDRELATIFDALLPEGVTATRESLGLRAADETRAHFEQERPLLAQAVVDAEQAWTKAKDDLTLLSVKRADAERLSAEVTGAGEERIQSQIDDAKAEKKAARSEVQKIRDRLKLVEAALRRAEERATPIREAGVFNRGTKLDAKQVRYEKQAAELRRQITDVSKELEAATTRVAEADARRVAAETELNNFRANRPTRTAADELAGPIAAASERLAAASSELQTARAVLAARVAEAQAEALMEARRQISEITRERIGLFEKGQIAGVNRMIDRTKAIKTGATTSDELPVLEAEVADLERQLTQIAGESALSDMDEAVKLAAARARAADAAANCQILRGVRL